MKIAFYAPMKPPDHPVPSGDRLVARLLMQALEIAGHGVTLACRFRSHDKAGDAALQERRRKAGLWLAGKLAARLRANPPDLWFTYHLYHKAPDWIGPAVCRTLGIPYVVAEASYAPKQSGGRWDLGHRAAADAIRAADALVGLSSADADCVRPLLEAPERLVAVRPFLETTPFRQAAADRPGHREDWSRRLSLDTNKPWLLAVGMFREGDKLASYRVLGDALSRLAGHDWQLLVAGYGPAEAAVKAALSPVADRCRWVGRLEREELAGLYAAADIMVWPAINEAYGMALLEAQSAGLPVVAGRILGVPDIVRDGETGLLAAGGDAGDFAARLGPLLADGARRRAMSDRALQSTAAHHDIAGASRLLDRIVRTARAPEEAGNKGAAHP
ncbi:glycosyltransferase family 4 protein [Radicibacter daui]|uniref:glycosyltransferase family 4 protein n=1 Tax=Radicibacter daui TaxID=3064829 RepID=UPI0040469748